MTDIIEDIMNIGLHRKLPGLKVLNNYTEKESEILQGVILENLPGLKPFNSVAWGKKQFGLMKQNETSLYKIGDVAQLGELIRVRQDYERVVKGTHTFSTWSDRAKPYLALEKVGQYKRH